MPVYEGLLEDISFRNDVNGFTVARIHIDREHVTAVGVMPFVGAGERVRVTGEWTEHREYGRQLKVSACESVKPETKSGIERYLASGLIKGVGPATAKLIIQHFGVKALDVLESEPDRLLEISGMGPKKARMIAESYAGQLKMRSAMLFLQSHDISPLMSMKIYRQYGGNTEQIIKGNPYRLVDDVDGIGFKTADRIAVSVGIPKESPARLESGLKYVLLDAASVGGHVYLPRTLLLEQAARILDVDAALLENELSSASLRHQFIACDLDGQTVVYLARLFETECGVARHICELKRAFQAKDCGDIESRISEYETREAVTLSPEQREAVSAAARGGLTIITGGPGTGKTTSIRCIIDLMAWEGKIVLAAPTGRAAKRMQEATNCPASTIHRLLEFNGEEGCFQRGRERPLEARTVIIDEMSMVDISLMQFLLDALAPNTRLVMVGDADQLPSVGAGNVLHDLIDSGVLPVVCLTEIFRQAAQSMIIQNAHRVNIGKGPLMNTQGTDFFIERKASIQETAQTISRLLAKRLPAYTGLNAIRDIQVLSPMKKSEVGVWELNRLLQETLNPGTPQKKDYQRGDVLFRLGDKVMQTRNNYQLEWTRGEKEEGIGVFNGDMGLISGIDKEENEVEVTFDDERCAIYDESILEDLELAYCISIHKSQGSEFPVVVIPVWNGPAMLMTRNLLYTAITRAKKLVVLVGREECVMKMVANNHIASRYTALNRRLIEAERKASES